MMRPMAPLARAVLVPMSPRVKAPGGDGIPVQVHSHIQGERAGYFVTTKGGTCGGSVFILMAALSRTGEAAADSAFPKGGPFSFRAILKNHSSFFMTLPMIQ